MSVTRDTRASVRRVVQKPRVADVRPASAWGSLDRSRSRLGSVSLSPILSPFSAEPRIARRGDFRVPSSMWWAAGGWGGEGLLCSAAEQVARTFQKRRGMRGLEIIRFSWAWPSPLAAAGSRRIIWPRRNDPCDRAGGIPCLLPPFRRTRRGLLIRDSSS
ncbi:MAG: hypothetical protein FD153_1450 [Rhodospirillaceae bacterium]|nr:MAG: hypothetical protein FD153_1450 [Rhodospirillaceae bacterium]